MKVLIVSPYAPERCGIASYAVQLAASLRREGHHVEVLSREPSAADHHDDLHTWHGMLRTLARSRQFDRTIIEFVPDTLFRTLRRFRFMAHYPWVYLLLAYGGGVELVVHEAPYAALRGALGARGRLARAMWRRLVRAPRVTAVHTPWERDQLVSAIGVRPDEVSVLDHGQAFFRRTRMSRDEARRELGLEDGKFHYLCIGFLQVHKGFDRAVTAMAHLPADRVHLHVVGSMRVAAPEIVQYVDDLRGLVDATAAATLHQGYVTDELFDRWIMACDAVVLPYREIWSSGVVERAKLYDKPTIVSDVGGMRDQVSTTTRVVRNDRELIEAMAALADVPVAGVPAEEDEPGLVDRAVALEAVQRRAALLRQSYEPMLGATRPAKQEGRTQPPPPVALPVPPGGRGLRTALKQAVYRLTRWQLVPLVRQANAAHAHLDEQMRATGARFSGLDGRVGQLDEDLRGLKGWIDDWSARMNGEVVHLRQMRGEDRRELAMAEAQWREALAGSSGHAPGNGAAPPPPPVEGHAHVAALYEAHQDRFRGTIESIRQRLETYVAEVGAVAGDSDALVLDIGPGRGEWLELLREHGIRAYGVDVNERFVALAAEHGLDVRLQDGLSHLRQAPEGSLAAITAFHVVEHIPVESLVELVDQSLRALRPGGLLILETPNPLNIAIGAGWFYLDPTHVRPVHPNFLQFVLEHRGFDGVRVMALHPPQEPPIEPAPADGQTLRRMAEVINRHFYTGEDYVVIGQRCPAGETRAVATDEQTAAES